MTEQRYRAVLEVEAEVPVTEVAERRQQLRGVENEEWDQCRQGCYVANLVRPPDLLLRDFAPDCIIIVRLAS
jgi:hypothetical protein